MTREDLDRVRKERLDRVDSNLEYLISTTTNEERLKREAIMMKEGIDDLYYALLDNM